MLAQTASDRRSSLSPSGGEPTATMKRRGFLPMRFPEDFHSLKALGKAGHARGDGENFRDPRPNSLFPRPDWGCYPRETRVQTPSPVFPKSYHPYFFLPAGIPKIPFLGRPAATSTVVRLSTSAPGDWFRPSAPLWLGLLTRFPVLRYFTLPPAPQRHCPGRPRVGFGLLPSISRFFG